MNSLYIAGGFSALLYILYAVIQMARRKATINFLGTLLALIGVGVPLALLSVNALNIITAPLLPAAIMASAGVIFVFSLIILIWNLRSPERQLNYSYGTLGLGMSVLLVAAIFTTPLIMAQFPARSAEAAGNAAGGGFAGGAGGNFPGAANGGGFPGGQPGEFAGGEGFPAGGFGGQSDAAATDEAIALDNTELLTVLRAETGLSDEELTAQLESESTLAELVTANDGDLQAVKDAVTGTFESMVAEGLLPASMLERFGGDAASVAESLINGDIPERGRALMVNLLLTGQAPGGGQFGAGGNQFAQSGNRPGQETAPAGESSDQPQRGGNPANPAGDTVPNEGQAGRGPGGGNRPNAQPESTEEAPESMPSNTPTPTPTRVLVTVTPTLLATATPNFLEPTATPEPTITCLVTVNYNLNVRAEPASDGELLTTIPFGSVVEATVHTESDWWRVSYDDMTGWANGEFITAGASCSELPTQP